MGNFPKIITLDTNVLVRIFVDDDDEGQQQAVLPILENATHIVIPITVFIETVWVLSSTYKMQKSDILTTLESFIDSMDNLIIEQDKVKMGFKMLALNGDFADMIHAFVGELQGSELFITFDKKAVNKLTALGHHALLLK